MRSTTGLILLALCCATYAIRLPTFNTHRAVIATRHAVPHGWTHEADPAHTEQVEFTVLLKQQNLDVLSERFDSVSDPNNKDYGKFMTMKQVNELIAPSESAFEAVLSWLAPHNVKIVRGFDHVKGTVDVKTAEKIFATQFKTHKHTSGRTLVRAHGVVTVPNHISEHIDFVAGITELFTGKPEAHSYGQASTSSQKFTRQNSNDIPVTPEGLRSFYNVPANLVGKNPNNLQGIAAFNDFFSSGALEQFRTKYNLPKVNVSIDGTSCLPNCDEGESDLDVQYMMAMARGVDLYFVQQGASYWILQFVEEVTNRLDKHPLIFSISYGFSELAQCFVATANCQKLGYTAQKYVARTNTALQKLGASGVTVLVADGDDGAPSLGAATGNCPIDESNYCLAGGCAHTESACSAFTLVGTDGTKCFFPMGLGSMACQAVIKSLGDGIQQALSDFASTNSACEWNVEQDKYNQPHVYSTCTCDKLQSTEYNGYKVQPYTYSAANGALFTADYPASSPYVTSVGATQWLSNDGTTVSEEVTASLKTGAHITTGGGFSTFQAAPKYQQAAVKAWAKRAKSEGTLPPKGSFDLQYRAYPDLSFNGHNYLIFLSADKSDQCPCQEIPVDGTSASSPALAGLFSLVNDALLNAGKTQLGFLNPLLYQMAVDQPSAFNDITKGDTKCTRGWCCQYGYTATTGYDPATGLGSPNFGEMLKYIKQKKGI